ncbi:MAG: 16S rRNA (uracil(1498)-N(3))-methyltransferase [Oscillospiraceae bacterium]|nr:16S rRNA (uracil(1498)-N(3))-methyltransferase [Oscillospiraceae bacterium]
MPRFFVAGTSLFGGLAVLRGENADHIKVLRMRVGEELTLCDGEGTDARCRIRSIDKDAVEAEILETMKCVSEPSVFTTLLCGLPKQGERSDYIVQKCTEAGASKIVFFVSKRCVARPDARSAEKKLMRLNKIAEEAAKQSGRGIIPEVAFLPDFVSALDCAVKTDLPLFMYETGDRVSLREACSGKNDIKTAAIITGPEGGFEPFEAELASKAGIKLCSMGPRILRCETAPLAALTMLMYETGNME